MQTFKTQGELIEMGYEPIFEADIYQEFDGSWHGYLTDNTRPSNDNIVEGGEFETRAQAQEWLDQVLEDIDEREVDVTYWNEPDPWQDYMATESRALAGRWA